MTQPRKIVLIGTNHSYQTRSPRCRPEDAQAFRRFLSKECRQYSIKTMAEEMSKEGLELSKKAWEASKEDWERKRGNPAWLEEDVEGVPKRCEEALEWHKEGMSIPQRVAKELMLKPLFCDPDSEQRKLLGIEDEGEIELKRDYDRSISDDEAQQRIRVSRTKRELCWLEQLQKKVSESEYPVLFICGAKHVDTFSKLLEENDFNVICICDDWEPQCH